MYVYVYVYIYIHVCMCVYISKYFFGTTSSHMPCYISVCEHMCVVMVL